MTDIKHTPKVTLIVNGKEAVYKILYGDRMIVEYDTILRVAGLVPWDECLVAYKSHGAEIPMDKDSRLELGIGSAVEFTVTRNS